MIFIICVNLINFFYFESKVITIIKENIDIKNSKKLPVFLSSIIERNVLFLSLNSFSNSSIKVMELFFFNFINCFPFLRTMDILVIAFGFVLYYKNSAVKI